MSKAIRGRDWDVFNVGRTSGDLVERLVIQKCDNSDRFQTDAEAIRYVLETDDPDSDDALRLIGQNLLERLYGKP